jgi:hypothetical protein
VPQRGLGVDETDNYQVGGCAATGRQASLLVDCGSTGFPHEEPSDDKHN